MAGTDTSILSGIEHSVLSVALSSSGRLETSRPISSPVAPPAVDPPHVDGGDQDQGDRRTASPAWMAATPTVMAGEETGFRVRNLSSRRQDELLAVIGSDITYLATK